MDIKNVRERLDKQRWLLSIQPFIVNKLCAACQAATGSNTCITSIGVSCGLLKDNCILGLPSIISNRHAETGKIIFNISKLRCMFPGAGLIGALMKLSIDEGLGALLFNRDLSTIVGTGSKSISDLTDTISITAAETIRYCRMLVDVSLKMARKVYGIDDNAIEQFKANRKIGNEDRVLTITLEEIPNVKPKVEIADEDVYSHANLMLTWFAEASNAMAGITDLFEFIQDLAQDNKNDYALLERDLNTTDASWAICEKAMAHVKAVMGPMALRLIKLADAECADWREIAQERGWDVHCRRSSYRSVPLEKRKAGETTVADGPLQNEALDYLWSRAYPKEESVEH